MIPEKSSTIPIDPAVCRNAMEKNGLGDSPFINLPIDIIGVIFSDLDMHDVKAVRNACKKLKQMSEDPTVMKIIALNSGIPIEATDSPKKIYDLIGLFNKISIHSFYECSPKGLLIFLKDITTVKADLQQAIKTLVKKHGDQDGKLSKFFEEKLNSLFSDQDDIKQKSTILKAAMQNMPNNTYAIDSPMTKSWHEILSKRLDKKGNSVVESNVIRNNIEADTWVKKRFPGFNEIHIIRK